MRRDKLIAHRSLLRTRRRRGGNLVLLDVLRLSSPPDEHQFKTRRRQKRIRPHSERLRPCDRRTFAAILENFQQTDGWCDPGSSSPYTASTGLS